jgi:hypothetical protein
VRDWSFVLFVSLVLTAFVSRNRGLKAGSHRTSLWLETRRYAVIRILSAGDEWVVGGEAISADQYHGRNAAACNMKKSIKKVSNSLNQDVAKVVKQSADETKLCHTSPIQYRQRYVKTLNKGPRHLALCLSLLSLFSLVSPISLLSLLSLLYLLLA